MIDSAAANHDLLELIERFYGAVTSPGAWNDTHAALVAHFGGTAATLFLDGSNTIVPIAFPGFSDEALRHYADYYHKADKWAEFARGLTPGQGEGSCFLSHDIVPAAEFEESEIWQDFSRLHVGAFHMMGSTFHVDGGTRVLMGLCRPRDAIAFEPADTHRLHVLVPHLRNALFLTHRLESAESIAKAGFDALENLAAGIAIVDRARQIVFANTAMERLAIAGDLFLRPDEGAARLGRRVRLSLAGSLDQGRFATLVEQTACGGAGAAMRVGHAEGERRLVLFVMPLPCRLSPRSSGGRIIDPGKVLVIVRDHGHPVALKGEILKTLFGFTDAETAVARSLIGGRSAEAVASERGVSLATVRTHIRRILEKADIQSLRELEPFVAAP